MRVTIDIQSNDSPKDLRALIRYLQDLASTTGDLPDVPPVVEAPPPAPVLTEEPDARTVFAKPLEVPPPAPVMETPPAPPPAPATTPATDRTGLPWDARIHSSTRSLMADGSWKRKRGVHDTEVARVEAELRGGPAVPPPPSTPAAPPPPSSSSSVTFPEFMRKVTAGVAAHRWTLPLVAEACQKAGVAGGIPALAASPDRIGAVLEFLGGE